MPTFTIELKLTTESADHETAADYGWALAQELRAAHPGEIGPIVEIKTQEHKQ